MPSPDDASDVRLRASGVSRMKTKPCITAEIADHVLAELRRGRALGDICGDAGIPHVSTIMRWVEHDRDGFAARYREARRTGHGNPGPVAYTAEVANGILDGLMHGRTVAEICRDP